MLDFFKDIIKDYQKQWNDDTEYINKEKGYKFMKKEMLKTIFIGDSGVGQTCLFKRILQQKLDNKSTVGIDFAQIIIVVDGQTFNLQMWDTAGQERFRALGSAYYQKADICFIVFDITSQQSFENVDLWLKQITQESKQLNNTEIKYMLLGNQSDKEKEREVQVKDIQNWCGQNPNIQYYECSAQTSTNIDTFLRDIPQIFLKPEELIQTAAPEQVEEVKSSIPLIPKGIKKIYQIILIGDAGCGKSSIITQHASKKFSEKYKATIGADFMNVETSKNDLQCMLQIWDTAGQERFQSLGIAFYRGSDACFLVFDLTNEKSFQALENWMNQFISQATVKDTQEFPFYVLGNKSDREDRKVSSEKVLNWITSKKSQGFHNMKYYESSAQDAVNTSLPFVDLGDYFLSM